MNIQWYPGHMTKAKRMMQENIKLVDLILELVDARVPFSSRNPDIDEMGRQKARIILLNKCDLADEKKTALWSGYFKEQGFQVVLVNSRSGAGLKAIQGAVQEACQEKIERDRKRPSGLWLWAFPMWENLPLLTALQERPVPRPAISRE